MLTNVFSLILITFNSSRGLLGCDAV